MGGMIAYALLMSPVHKQDRQRRHPGLADDERCRPSAARLRRAVPRPAALCCRRASRSAPLARLGAPFAPLLAAVLWTTAIAELGWHPGNADVPLLRTLMLTAVDDLPASLLREFARWYDTKAMSDRYAMFDFTEHLERVTTPILIIAGSKDGLTPARDLEHVYERIASRDKAFRVIGKEHGFAHDYSHADLVLGLHAPGRRVPRRPRMARGASPQRRAQRRGRRCAPWRRIAAGCNEVGRPRRLHAEPGRQSVG